MKIQRFHSRRVWLLHSLLLLAVLVVAYISGSVQYRTIRDQRIEELRTQQQNWARTSGNLIEQNIRLLAVMLPDLEEPLPEYITVSGIWLKKILTIDRSNPQALSHLSEESNESFRQQVQQLCQQTEDGFPRILSNGADIWLVTMTRDTHQLRLGLLSGERIASELLAIKSRVLDADSYLIVDEKMVLSGTGIVDSMDQIITDASLLQEIKSSMQAGLVGAPAPDWQSNGELTLLTLQPIIPVTGARWFLLIKRDNVDAYVDQNLRPLIWQLVSSSVTMVVAVMVILISTTISLFRGRRRIERLRMEMLNRDLQKARSIQLKWLPPPCHQTEHYRIAAVNEPAAHISGDFYNWFDLSSAPGDPSRTALLIGDVSGHGLPAAFLMATTQLILKNTLFASPDPGKCLTELNRQLCSLAYQGQFVTLLIMVVEYNESRILMASAGQAAPLLKRDNDCFSVSVESQLVAGVDPTMQYHTQSVPIRRGDQLLLFTDGVVETTNESGEQFGYSRLIEAFRNAPKEPQKTLHSILGAIAAHRQGNEPDDDLTMVAFQWSDPILDTRRTTDKSGHGLTNRFGSELHQRP